MMRLLTTAGMLWSLLGSSCLNLGCEMKLASPADAFNVGSQKDRTIKVKKSLFGAKAEIPLTDLKLKVAKVAYNPDTGGFDIVDLDVDQSWSSTMTIENARIAENQNLYLALTTAQQEVYDRKIDAWKEVGNHAIDAAASAIGLLAKSPGGGQPAADLMGNIMGTLDPQMLQRFIGNLTKQGVPITPTNPTTGG